MSLIDNNRAVNRKLILAFAPVFALILNGCGGSASSSGEPAAREASFGPISTRAVGPIAEPVVMTGGNSTITGIFNASFLNVTVNLPPSSPKSDEFWDYQVPVALSVRHRGGYFDFSNLRPYVPYTLAALTSGEKYNSFSTNGQAILSVEPDSSGVNQIFSTLTDGSSRVQLTSGGSSKSSPTQSPLTGQIAFESQADIWVMPANGGVATNLTSSADVESFPRFNPSGSKVGYLRTNGGNRELWEMDSNGANKTIKLGGTPINSYDYHPTEPMIAFQIDGAGPSYIQLLNLENLQQTAFAVAASPVNFRGIAFSPSGALVATRRYDGTNYALSVFNVTTRTRVDYPGLDSSIDVGKWAPLPRKKFFINATAATLHTNAAGFLFGTKGENFVSMLAFDAQTRNTVDIDPHPGALGSENYTATITAADKLTMLRYANGMIDPRVTIIDPANVATHAQGAIVSFVSNSGKVGSVLTFTRSANGNKPQQTRGKEFIEFSGEFLAAYDAQGKLIKSRPTDVKVSLATGKLSYR